MPAHMSRNLLSKQGPEEGSAAAVAVARLARSLKLWLDLQGSVNGFIDSTASDKGTVVRRFTGKQDLPLC